MGFSAGGHVCADLAARFAAGSTSRSMRPTSSRPSRICAAPIYPVVSMDRAVAHAGSRELLLGANPTPALEAAHSPDRNVPPTRRRTSWSMPRTTMSFRSRTALRCMPRCEAAKVPVETHLFANGGHGFGLRKAIGKPVEAWPELWRAWARTVGLG